MVGPAPELCEALSENRLLSNVETSFAAAGLRITSFRSNLSDMPTFGSLQKRDAIFTAIDTLPVIGRRKTIRI